VSMETFEGVSKDVTSKYQQVSVETADQLTLIIMLYDGLIRFLSRAADKMKSGEVAYYECRKAQDILFHLMNTLRKDGGEISRNLLSLYFFIYRQTVMADMERNARRIEEILPVIREIKSGWEELRRKQREKGE